ncbi:MAG: O-antigen ligase family protein [Acidobacteria bacterium]|nr:O-antigen ligase family protein [Acidobacteriota bacterium]
MNMAVPVLVMVAWGALAFGAVYDWAYWPLLAAGAIVGVWGLLRHVPRVRRRAGGALLLGILLVAAAIGAQLIPVDRATLVRMSPATDEFLRQYDVAYAFGVVMETRAAAQQQAMLRAQQRQAETPPAPPKPLLPSAGEGGTSAPVAPARESITHPISINPDKTLLGLVFVVGFGLLLLGLQRGLNGLDLRAFAPGLTVLGVVLALIGIVQKALWNGKVYGFWVPENTYFQAFGPFINRNHFAGWMLLALPVVIGYFASQVAKGMVGISPDWRSRIGWFSTPAASRAVLTGFSVLVMGLALTLSLSRSGISCFLLAIVLSAVSVWRHQTGSTKGRLLAAYFLVVFVAAVSWTGIDAIGQRFGEVGWEFGGRTGAWTDAWRIHQMFPAFGTGFNTYGTATTLLQQFLAAYLHFSEAHNDYLQVLTEGGYFVAVPAALLILIFVWQVIARFREGHDDRTSYWIRVGATTGIVAMAFQEIVEFSLQIPGDAALFVVLCAIAVRRTSPKNHPPLFDRATVERPHAPDHTAPGPGTRFRATGIRSCTAAIGIALVVSCALASGACRSGSGGSPPAKAVYEKDTGKLTLLMFDTNKDGKTDVWSHMDGTRLVRMEIDTNFDGVIDRWEYYTPDGALEKVGSSRFNDGRVDAWAFEAAGGGIARMEISTRRDGKVSRWEVYENGALARAEEDTTGNGKPDKWETYSNGTLASVAFDTQKRGTPDRRLVYGPGGVTVEKLK